MVDNIALTLPVLALASNKTTNSARMHARRSHWIFGPVVHKKKARGRNKIYPGGYKSVKFVIHQSETDGFPNDETAFETALTPEVRCPVYEKAAAARGPPILQTRCCGWFVGCCVL